MCDSAEKRGGLKYSVQFSILGLDLKGKIKSSTLNTAVLMSVFTTIIYGEMGKNLKTRYSFHTFSSQYKDVIFKGESLNHSFKKEALKEILAVC